MILILEQKKEENFETNLLNEFLDGFNTIQQYLITVEMNGLGRKVYRELLLVIRIPHLGHNLNPIIGDFVIQYQLQILCNMSTGFIITDSLISKFIAIKRIIMIKAEYLPSFSLYFCNKFFS